MNTEELIQEASAIATERFGDNQNRIQGFLVGYCTLIPFSPSGARDFSEGFTEGRRTAENKVLQHA